MMETPKPSREAGSSEENQKANSALRLKIADILAIAETKPAGKDAAPAVRAQTPPPARSSYLMPRQFRQIPDWDPVWVE